MSDHHSASSADRPVQIKNPDQLQQARRPEQPRPTATADGRRAAREAPAPCTGVLHQLETERAHD